MKALITAALLLLGTAGAHAAAWSLAAPATPHGGDATASVRDAVPPFKGRLYVLCRHGVFAIATTHDRRLYGTDTRVRYAIDDRRPSFGRWAIVDHSLAAVTGNAAVQAAAEFLQAKDRIVIRIAKLYTDDYPVSGMANAIRQVAKRCMPAH